VGGLAVPDEGDVHAEAPVDGGAVEAEEDAVGNGCQVILGKARFHYIQVASSSRTHYTEMQKPIHWFVE
jgi:hypothetical protein